MNRRDVAITGVGPVCAIGISRDEFAGALLEGRCGIQPVTGFDADGLGCSLAAEVAHLDMSRYLRSAKNYLDRNSELSFAACELALRDAGIELPLKMPERVAFCMGSQWGNMQTMAAFAARLREKGARLVPPFLFPHTYPNTTASLLAIEYGIKGYHEVFFGNSVSGAMAVSAAARVIRSGGADAAVAGGADALCAELYSGCALARMLSPARTGKGEEGCRPFAADRNGTVLGEGGAFLVLESGDHALARGRKPQAILAADAMAGSITGAIRRVLNGAGIAPSEISAVFCAANGDPEGDGREMNALREVFGKSLPQLFTLKAQVGECMGAFGPLNLIAATLVERPGGDCALVNSFDQDGNSVSFVVRRP